MQLSNTANDPTSLRLARLEELVATQEAALVRERAKVARLQNESEKLRDAYARLRQELNLLQQYADIATIAALVFSCPARLGLTDRSKAKVLAK